MTNWRYYDLPNCPSQRYLDRFSILDDEEEEDGLIQFWPLLCKVLKQPVDSAAQLVDILDTISNTICGSSGVSGDYGMLTACVQDPSTKFFSDVWQRVVFFALQMPACFPSGQLGILEPGRELRLSRTQAACLVAHQFLGSLKPPSWRSEYYDFRIWYDSSQRHPAAVKMYLNALFIYFGQSVGGADDEQMVVYSMSAFDKPEEWLKSPDSELMPLTKAEIIVVDKFSTESQELKYQGPYGATVISANKDIGFGQSATQEEIFVGNCPEACPAVLVTPTLTDDQIFAVQGASPMLRIHGQRRDIAWSVLEPEARQGGRMLFMDALEIDEIDDGVEELPDLRPDLIDREIKKAYTAFSSWNCDRKTNSGMIWTGTWGCGAFNGDPAIKMTILWISASLAGKELRIVCDSNQTVFATQFAKFIEQIPKSCTVKNLKARLQRIPRTTRRLETLDSMLDT